MDSDEFKAMVEKDLRDKITRIANGEKIQYGEKNQYLTINGTYPDLIVGVIEDMEESGNFDGYLDGNGVDQDWSYDLTFNGNPVHLFGSITGGSCVLQTPN